MVIVHLEELQKNKNNHVYDSTSNASELNYFQGVFLNLNYKNVMHFFKFIENQEYDKACFVIGITEEVLKNKGEKYLETLYKYLNSERFLTPSSNNTSAKLESLKKRGVIKTKEEEEEYIKEQNIKAKKKQVFCHFGDFDLIHSLFEERWGIDLMKDDINYFIYTFKLNAIMEEESNALISRIKARSFKPTSGKGTAEINKQGRKLKQKYSLI